MKVVAIDTNILLDYFFEREAGYQVAKDLIEKATQNMHAIFISLPVFLEFVWTLKSYYRLPKDRVIKYLQAVLEMPNCELVDRSFSQKAISLYGETVGASFYDCLIAVIAKHAKVDDFITHDLKLKRLYEALK